MKSKRQSRKSVRKTDKNSPDRMATTDEILIVEEKKIVPPYNRKSKAGIINIFTDIILASKSPIRPSEMRKSK